MIVGKGDGPRAFRSSPAFILNNAVDEEAIEKVCKCGHYDTPTAMGYCQDEDCRRERLIKALHEGKAQKLKDGTIVWDVE